MTAIEPYSDKTIGGAPTFRRGSIVPPDSVNLSWVKSPQVSPVNNVTIIDTSQITPQNINQNVSGFYYANELGILQDISGNQLFGEPFPYITDQFSVNGNLTGQDLTGNYYYPFCHVSRYFHIDAIGLCPGSSLTNYVSSIIKVVDSNGRLYVDNNGNPLYQIQICPAINLNINLGTESPTAIGAQMPYRVYVYLTMNTNTNLYLAYDKVEINAAGLIVNQVLNYQESINLKPLFEFRPEPSEVVDLTNIDKHWFSSKSSSYEDEILGNISITNNGYNVYVPKKALNDPRLFQPFRWRVTCNFKQVFKIDQDQQTLNVGVIITNNDRTSLAAQFWNALADPQINKNNILFVNPLTTSSDPSQDEYWYVNIDTLSTNAQSNSPSNDYTQQLDLFDILIWIPTADNFNFSKYISQINYFTNVLGKTLIIDTENGCVPSGLGFATSDAIMPTTGGGYHGIANTVYAGSALELNILDYSESQLDSLFNQQSPPFPSAKPWNYISFDGITYKSGINYQTNNQNINPFDASSLGGWAINNNEPISVLQAAYGPFGAQTQFITQTPSNANNYITGSYAKNMTINSPTVPTNTWSYIQNESVYNSVKSDLVTGSPNQRLLEVSIPAVPAGYEYLRTEIYQSTVFSGHSGAIMATYLNGAGFNNLEHIAVVGEDGQATILAGDYSNNPQLPSSVISRQLIDVIDNNSSNTIISQSLSATVYYFRSNNMTTQVPVAPNTDFTFPALFGIPLLSEYNNVYFSTFNLISSVIKRFDGAQKLLYNICLIATQNKPLTDNFSQYASSYQFSSPWALSWVINTTSNPNVLSSLEKAQYNFVYLPAIAPENTTNLIELIGSSPDWGIAEWGTSAWSGTQNQQIIGTSQYGGWGTEEWGSGIWEGGQSNIIYLWQRQLSTKTLKELIDHNMSPQMLQATANTAREYIIEVTNPNIFVSSELGDQSIPFAWTTAYTPELEIPADYTSYIVQEKEIPATYEAEQYIDKSYPARPYAFQIIASYDDSITLSDNLPITWTAYCSATLTYNVAEYIPPITIVNSSLIKPTVKEVELSWLGNSNKETQILDVNPYKHGTTALPNGLYLWSEANYHNSSFGPGQDNFIFNGLTGRYALGSTGAPVQFIQDILNKVNNAGLIVDGIYNSSTANAIEAFQIKMGARYIDGVVDAETWSLIGGSVISNNLKNTGQSWGQFYDYAKQYMQLQSISDGNISTVFGKRSWVSGGPSIIWEIFSIFFGYNNIYNIHGIKFTPFVLGNAKTEILDAVHATLLKTGTTPLSYLTGFDSANMMIKNINRYVNDNETETISFSPVKSNFILVAVGQDKTSFPKTARFLGIRDITALATITTPGSSQSTLVQTTIPGYTLTNTQTTTLSLTDSGSITIAPNMPVTIQCLPNFKGKGALSNIEWINVITSNPSIQASITPTGKLTLINNDYYSQLGVTIQNGPQVNTLAAQNGVMWYAKTVNGQINPWPETAQISKDEGLILLCKSNGTPFGFPSIPPSTSDTQRQLTTFRLSSIGTSAQVLMGFYDSLRNEFITDAAGNPAISYNDYIRRGPNNIYVGVISTYEVDALQSLPTFSPTNQNLANSDDAPYVPNMMVLPLYGVQTNTSNKIGLANLPANLSPNDIWPISIKPGKFSKHFTIPSNSVLFQFQGSPGALFASTPTQGWGISKWGSGEWQVPSGGGWGSGEWGIAEWTGYGQGWGSAKWGIDVWGSSSNAPAANTNTTVAPGSVVTGFYEINITESLAPYSTLFGPPNIDILGETPIILDTNILQVVQTPILLQQFPTNMSSPADPVLPIFTVYFRNTILDPWIALGWDKIADYNTTTGVITLQNVDWKDDPNLWMVNYTSVYPYYMLKLTDIIDFTQSTLSHVLTPVNLNPTQTNNKYLNETLYVYAVPKFIIDSNGNRVAVRTPYKYPISITTNSDLFNPSSNIYDPSVVLLGLIRVANNFDVSELVMIDSRVRGGGIPNDIQSLQAYETVQEAINYWDINYGSGMSYQTGGFILIRLPIELKNIYSDEFIRSVIDKNVPAGIAYRIEDLSGNNWEITDA